MSEEMVNLKNIIEKKCFSRDDDGIYHVRIQRHVEEMHMVFNL